MYERIRFYLLHHKFSRHEKYRVGLSCGIVFVGAFSIIYPEMGHLNAVSATVINLFWLWE